MQNPARCQTASFPRRRESGWNVGNSLFLQARLSPGQDYACAGMAACPAVRAAGGVVQRFQAAFAVRPKRCTHSPPQNKSVCFPKTKPCARLAPHSPPEWQRPSEKCDSGFQTAFSGTSAQPQLRNLPRAGAVVAEGFDKRQDLVAVVGKRTLGEGGVEGVEAGQAVDAGRAVDPAVGQAGE